MALGANVPPVFIDQNQLERAVLNLTMNGRDAIAGNAGTITIEAETAVVEDGEPRSGAADAVPGSYVRVTVRDTGTGMPPEVRNRAFEPFFTTKAPGQGTGLGLSQVYGFMRQSKGHVSIESHEGGGGTAIHLFLPVAAT